MDRLATISDSLQLLNTLSEKKAVFLDDIQLEFRPDLQHYLSGATLSIQDGKIIIGSKLYKGWLEKIKTKGFDYEIDFNK